MHIIALLLAIPPVMLWAVLVIQQVTGGLDVCLQELLERVTGEMGSQRGPWYYLAILLGAPLANRVSCQSAPRTRRTQWPTKLSRNRLCLPAVPVEPQGGLPVYPSTCQHGDAGYSLIMVGNVGFICKPGTDSPRYTEQGRIRRPPSLLSWIFPEENEYFVLNPLRLIYHPKPYIAPDAYIHITTIKKISL